MNSIPSTKVSKTRPSLVDMIKTAGHLKVTTVSKDGTRCTIIDDKNMVMVNAKLILSEALAGGSVDSRITNLQLGDGFDSASPLSMTEIALRNSLVDVEFNVDGSPQVENSDGELVDPATYIVLSGSFVRGVLFTINLSPDEYNGAGTQTFTEAGLFSAGGDLYAMRGFDGNNDTPSAIVKNNTVRVIIEWALTF